MIFSQIFVLLFFAYSNVISKYLGQPISDQNDLFENVYTSRGVVEFLNTDKNYNKNITIYEKNGTVFSVISLKKNTITFKDYKTALYGPKVSKSLSENKYHFAPQQFYPDNGITIFSYKDIHPGKVEVYVDKENKITKFIKIDPSLFSVKKWSVHLMGAVTSVDNVKNPLKSKPSNLSAKFQSIVPDDASFRIIKLSGQWAQVECFSFCESVCEEKYRGWVKWTDGKRPLLTLYYAC